MTLKVSDVRVKDMPGCGLACPYFEARGGMRCNRRGGKRIPHKAILSDPETPDWCPLREKPILLRLRPKKN